MCPVLPPATAIKKFDRQNEGLIVWFIPWSLLDRLIYLSNGLDRLISCSKRTGIQAYAIGHAHLPFMRSVRDQNARKIAVAGGSTGHTAVTTPWWLHVAKCKGHVPSTRCGDDLYLILLYPCPNPSPSPRFPLTPIISVVCYSKLKIANWETVL